MQSIAVDLSIPRRSRATTGCSARTVFKPDAASMAREFPDERSVPDVNTIGYASAGVDEVRARVKPAVKLPSMAPVTSMGALNSAHSRMTPALDAARAWSASDVPVQSRHGMSSVGTPGSTGGASGDGPSLWAGLPSVRPSTATAGRSDGPAPHAQHVARTTAIKATLRMPTRVPGSPTWLLTNPSSEDRAVRITENVRGTHGCGHCVGGE